MKRIDYLKDVVNRPVALTTKWVYSVCSVAKHAQVEPYIIVHQPWGCEFTDDQGQVIKIEDSKPNRPLFLANEKITISQDWFNSTGKDTDTCIGNIIFHVQVILPSFGRKYGFIDSNTSVPKIEEKIVGLLRDTPLDESQREDSEFYCDEYVKFRDCLQVIRQYPQLFTYSATEKSISPPTGIEKEKKRLLEDPKYKGKLEDPLVLADFEKELKKFDDEFLKGDPTRGKFVAGKVVDIHRKKLFLTLGKEVLSFDGKPARTVVKSLDETISHEDSDDFVAAMNSLRVGSYSRGAETVNGGVASKILGRFGDNISILDTDCGSTMGVEELIHKDNVKLLVGSYLLNGNKPKLVNDLTEASSYLGTVVKMRSPARCWMPSNEEKYCRVCFGENMFRYKDGMAIPLKEIGGIILNTSMKAMHGKVLSTAYVDINLHAS